MNRRSPSTITRWPWRFGDINASDSVFWTHSEVVLLMPTALLASHQEKIQDIWKEKKKIRRVRHKPGSVLGQCQGQLSIWDDCYQSPLAVHQNGIGKRPTWFHRPCSQPGFTEPVPLDTAGALLPSPLHPYLFRFQIYEKSVHCYGGMFLWHYPHAHAHWALPSKFGLSGARTFLGARAKYFGLVCNCLRSLSITPF